MDGITDAININLGKVQEMVRDREAWGAESQRVRHDWATEQQQISYSSLGILSIRASLVAQIIKNLPVMQETRV